MRVCAVERISYLSECVKLSTHLASHVIDGDAVLLVFLPFKFIKVQQEHEKTPSLYKNEKTFESFLYRVILC